MFKAMREEMAFCESALKFDSNEISESTHVEVDHVSVIYNGDIDAIYGKRIAGNIIVAIRNELNKAKLGRLTKIEISF